MSASNDRIRSVLRDTPWLGIAMATAFRLDALEAVATEAAKASERLACLHDFDPECGRCEWLSPLRAALVALARAPMPGSRPDEEGTPAPSSPSPGSAPSPAPVSDTGEET